MEKRPKTLRELDLESVALSRGRAAHEMHLAGKSWKQVGEHFGVSRQRAQQMAVRWLREQKDRQS